MMVTEWKLDDVSRGKRDHVLGWHPMLEEIGIGNGPLSLGRKAGGFLEEKDAAYSFGFEDLRCDNAISTRMPNQTIKSAKALLKQPVSSTCSEINYQVKQGQSPKP